MKQILGIVGEKRAGKDTFYRAFRHMAESDRLGVVTHHYSDIITESFKPLCLPLTRENMQSYSPLIEIKYGKGVFSRAMSERTLLSDADIVVIQGVRWMTDLTEIRRIGGTLVYVTADKKIRFDRARKDPEKPDEVGITWEKFEEQENAETEIFIPIIGSKANFRLENDGTVEEFYTRVTRFAVEYLPSWAP